MPGLALQGDFTAGELSPSLTARVDLAKYSKGCRKLKNFIVQAHGGAVKRPGFELLGELKGEAALVPFIFNQEQAYCLCLGEKWLAVFKHGGFVLDEDGTGPRYFDSPYTLEQARQLSHIQSADVLFIACTGVAPMRLERHAEDDWRFVEMKFTAPIDAPATVTATAQGTEGTLNTPLTYFVTALDEDGKESNKSENTSSANVKGPASNNWPETRSIKVTWSAVEGADSYRVYKAEYNGRPGFVAEVTKPVDGGALEWVDSNVTPSTTEGAPEYRDIFADGDYPATVCLFEQRLVFASTPKRPQTIWMSKTGDYANFAKYTPEAADSPIELTIAAQEVSKVQWMIPLRSLILGMSGMEWELAARNDAAFSASNAKATPQSYWGSSLKKAMIVGNVILHVASSGRQVRSLQYEFSADSYGGMDLSIMASHLLERYGVVDWAYQKNPDSILWLVREDGDLLGLTFQAEHQISAWHQHSVGGTAKAVCATPHGFEHSLFILVERNGRFFVERMAPRYMGGDFSRAVFLDCALTYDGTPITSLAGLDHLECQRVGILADGAVHPDRIVKDGRITLEREASIVVVGLPYEADLETMPIETQTQAGVSVTLKKQVNAANILFRDSMGVKVGLEFGEKMQTLKWRTDEPYGQAPRAFSGMRSVTLPALADNVVTVCLRSDTPTPLTVLALASRLEVNQQ